MSILTEIFGDTPRVKIIEVFVENNEEMRYIAEIVKITDLSKMTVTMHINKLLNEGIIRKTKKTGNIQHYQLNENNPKTKAILKIVKEIGSSNLTDSFNKDNKTNTDITTDSDFSTASNTQSSSSCYPRMTNTKEIGDL